MKVYLILAIFGQVAGFEGPGAPDRLAACEMVAKINNAGLDKAFAAQGSLPAYQGKEFSRGDITFTCMTLHAKPTLGDNVATLGSF